MKKHLLTGAFILASFFTANAQIEVTVANPEDPTQPLALEGAYVITLAEAGAFTGDLTGVDFDVTLEASAGGTYANDLAILVATGLTATDETVVQIGGGSNFGATQEHLMFGEGQGDSAEPGTTLQGSLDLTTPLTMTGTNYKVYLGNGYVNETGDNAGAWSGTVVLKGLSLSTAGMDENNINALSVFPNPANDVINVVNNENILVNGVTVTDLNGRTVKTVKYNNVAEAQVNISDIASGVYMVTISSDKGQTTRKFIKK